MIQENEIIDLAHTVMGMHINEDGSKNQIAAMLDFAEQYHNGKMKLDKLRGQSQEKQRTEHELKIWPEYFDDVASGKKPFEVRKLDRLFGVGNILRLREWSPIPKPGWQDGYSGRECKKEITYLMIGGKFGVPEGVCIMGLKELAQPEHYPRWVKANERLPDKASIWLANDKDQEGQNVYCIVENKKGIGYFYRANNRLHFSYTVFTNENGYFEINDNGYVSLNKFNTVEWLEEQPNQKP